MTTISIPTVYDELVEYLAQKATPEEILAFKISDEAQERAEVLLERNSDGTLTPEENLELQQMLHFDGLVSILKTSALEKLN